MKCPECHIELPEGSKFCKECGKKLELTCPKCGKSIPPDSKFCLECGHSLTSPKQSRIAKTLSFDEKLAKIQKYLPGGLTEKILSQKDRIEGERRHVTIMFVDMKGFTPLTEKLGPEETFSLMDQVFELIIHKVHEYEGTVNELRGDGVLALFGAPVALEDAPQRAIRSSLAIHREMVRFSEKIKGEVGISPILVRIGINTGPVVVGTLGNDLRVQFTAVGDTINMAARMEQLAEPGTTYVTEDTFRLTEGLFRFEALGERDVKGKEKPMKVFQVIAPSTRRTRFDVSAERGLSRFIGRQRELELLLDAFERAKAGRGQAVSIMGEAGVGKSRLLYEFRKAVANEDILFLEGKCLSYGRGVAYHPIIDLLKSNFRVEDGDTDSAITEKVKRGLAVLGVDEVSTLPYLLELLSVKESGIDKIMMSPEVKKDRICSALQRVVLKGSERSPLVFAFEDLHWMDKSSEEAAKYLLDSIPGARVLMIFTYRPEFVHTWGGKSFHSQLTLNRLSNRESLALVADLLGSDNISSELQDLILEKTEGVPFFIEEFVRSLMDMQIIKQADGAYLLSKGVKEITIPATIHDTIMARIDLLPVSAKEILQLASVIEREFEYELIKLAEGLPEDDLLCHLSALKDSELVYERGVYPHSTFIFKHSLIQDLCYQSLLKTTRRRYHGTIANVIEQHFPEKVRELPDLLAHHFTEAEMFERAIIYWRKAGELAVRRSANLEAVDHLRKALALLTTQPEGLNRVHQELDLQIALGPALMAAKGYAAPEVEKTYKRARELCKQLHETPQVFGVLRGLWGYYVVRGELRTSRELGEECLGLALRAEDPALVLWSHYSLGMSLAHLGELQSARDHLEQGVAVYDPGKRHGHRALQDPGVACLSYRALVLWMLGYSDQAIKSAQNALELARTLSHAFSIAYAANISALLSQLRREIHEVLDKSEAAGALCAEQGLPYWLSWGPILRGWGLAQEGQVGEGIKEQWEGLRAYTATGANLVRPYFLALLAEAHAQGGNHKAALKLIAQALAVVATTGEHWCESELYRLKGESILMLTGQTSSEAEACFRQAVDTARRQMAKFFELRSLVSLCRLWTNQGKKIEARRTLQEVCNGFTEGLDSGDFKAARQLMDELL